MEPEPPFCRDCSHLIGVRSQWENAAVWKCGAEANIDGISADLVTGVPVKHYQYATCYEARMHSGPEMPPELHGCGPEGHWFHLYVRPEYPSLRQQGPHRSAGADALLDELENLK